MNPTATQSDSLDQLQSPEQVALLDAIDKLRGQGIGHYNISLPQLIVCGNQSSGKSSVLEGLTRLRFPAKEGLCTTFATELVLRRQDTVEIVCTIIPSKERTSTERRELSQFSQCFSSREEFSFPLLINEAKKCMSGETRSKPEGKSEDFFEDVLRIRYSGPDVPPLTIVDLPGIISAQLRNNNGVERVLRLIEGYMRDEKSIILAVVAADYDLEIQKVFDYIEKFDPMATRTLGIITKPDRISGPESEKNIIKLASNEHYPLWHGWHVVRNRSPTELECSDVERDQSEKDFFEKGIWLSLLRSDIGINELRKRLSKVLLEHIVKELPSLISAIQDAITTTEASLKALGHSRDSPQQQREYLIGKAESFRSLTFCALEGIYRDSFFNPPTQNEETAARLRTRIQNLNLAFAHVMYHKGHHWHIVGNGKSRKHSHVPAIPESVEYQDYEAEFIHPASISKADFLQQHITVSLHRNRQSGLQMIANPRVIGEIFRQQSQAWKEIANYHVERVFEAVQDYTALSLGNSMDARTHKMLMLEHIDYDLEQRWKSVSTKLEELLLPYTEQDPVTYDPTFLYEIEKIRSKRYTTQSNDAAHGKPSMGQLLTVDDFTSSEILDLVQTYYNKAISVFINNVAVLAIENCLIARLESMFSSVSVSSMGEDKLRAIASESKETQDEREALTQKLKDLIDGKRILHVHACDTGSGLRASSRSQRPSSRARRADSAHSQPREAMPELPKENHDRLETDDITSLSDDLTGTPPPSDSGREKRVKSRRRSGKPTPPKKKSKKHRPSSSSDTAESESEE